MWEVPMEGSHIGLLSYKNIMFVFLHLSGFIYGLSMMSSVLEDI
jgi:hypothetical protein